MILNISKNSLNINEKFDKSEALGKRNQFLLGDLRIAIDDVKGKQEGNDAADETRWNAVMQF